MRHTALNLALSAAALLLIGGCSYAPAARPVAAAPICSSPSLGYGDSLGQTFFAEPASQQILDSLSNTHSWHASADPVPTPVLAVRD